MNLREKQVKFASLLANLILMANNLGYEVTLGEIYRSKEEAARLASLGKGIKNSLHCLRLAADINLFKDGQYLTRNDDYERFGVAWELQTTEDYECHWGGRFGDGNHFSIGHNGRK